MAGGWPEKREKRKESETHFSELTYTTSIAKKNKERARNEFCNFTKLLSHLLTLAECLETLGNEH